MHVSRLVLACRNVKKGEIAKEAILAEGGSKSKTQIEVWEVDLESYASVRASSERVRTPGTLERLDGVIANAGIEMTSFEASEGLERTLTVNVISTVMLCLGVLPKLTETATTFGVTTRLKLVGSLIHYFGSDTQLASVPESQSVFDALSDPKTAQMASRYSLSKLIEHLCFNQLVQRVEQSDVIINLVNPGWCGMCRGLTDSRACTLADSLQVLTLDATRRRPSWKDCRSVCLAGLPSRGAERSCMVYALEERLMGSICRNIW